MRYTPAAILLCMLAQSGSTSAVEGGQPRSEVTVLGIDTCDAFGHVVECQTLEVVSEGLPPRELTLRCYRRTDSSGALILTTGGTGTSFYSNYGPQAELTIEYAYSLGLEIYEVKWNGDMGWATDAEGARGYDRAVGAYSTILKWMHDNLIDNPQVLFAHGNSGGSIQIAYGLALYELEDYLDMVILSGGPPVADLVRAIFGELNDPSRWPDGLAGFWLTDYIMGWLDNGDWCVERYVPPEFEDMVYTALDSVSLVSPTAPRDFSHPATKVQFVQTNDSTNADDQANLYYESLTGETNWYFIGEITEHAVPSTPEGAEVIRQLIFEELMVPVSVDQIGDAAMKIEATPNPFHLSTTITFYLSRSATGRLDIFSIDGRRVRALAQGPHPEGEQIYSWDGRDDQGREMPSGFYLARVVFEGAEPQTQRVVLIR